ncbi:DNA polymerase II subunit B3-1-like [Vicia villosa]|uniref:DNA polymerase II subunit B3-1-like n=1 Tax=Vicia villosa TaxID=3911 RepID=UPI00273CA940|nr:DNA polymerase II subunit B3-1-like [Vicia villosa]
MASSNNSIAENKKAKKPETSTPTSKIKKEKDVEKSSEKKKKNNEEIKSNKSKKLKFTNGNSKEKEENGVKHENNDEEEGGGDEEAKTNVFPMSRIRTIIKAEISDLRVTQEAILAINKATEKFLEQLALEAYACCAQDRKKYLSYNHLSNVVSKQKRFDFLSDFVPEKVKAEDALRETISRGDRGG